MFVPHCKAPDHELIGKTFELIKNLSNMNGTFLTGTILTCTEVVLSNDDLRAVWLEDKDDNKLLVDVFNFYKSCQAIK